MLVYILKFSACLFLFLGFYKLFLERESFHKLKRFYLLFALALSLSIPFITYTEYVEISPVETTYNTEAISDIGFQETIIVTSWTDYLPNIILSLYLIGCLVFSFRFAKHLHQLYFKIKRNPKLKDHKFTNVLLRDEVNPHTFFKYIFLNKHRFEQHLIPKEVLLHEQTHAKQLHALDILLVEALQIIFWFHPLLYIIKKDIKLNHEFLADQSVIKEGAESSAYQQLLLAFSSSATEHPLANAINYSSIKKRLTVMKTQTSRSRTWIKSLLLLPLLAVLIYSFSSEKVEYLYPEPNDSFINPGIELYLNTKGELFHENQKIEIQELASIQPLEDDMNISIETSLETDVELTKTVSKEIQAYLRQQGLKGFSICTNSIAENTISKKELIIVINVNSVLVNGKPSSLKSFKNDVDAVTKEWEEIDYTSVKPKVYLASSSQDFIKTLEAEFRFTHFSKANEGAELIPPSLEFMKKYVEDTPSSLNPDQDGVTRAQMAKYNTWAKNINTKTANANRDKNKSYPIIKLKEVEKYKYIYQLMSDKQRKNAEPFPNLPQSPPPPPPIPPNATKELRLKYQRAIDQYNSKKGIVHKGEVSDIPPPPPPPQEPLDHVIDMAKKNAVFYLEGKKVSSDKAIEALKKNKSLNIEIKGSNSRQPKVYITKKGITIKKTTADTSYPNNKSNKITLSTGNIKVNGEELFYTTKDGITSYFNTYGQQVDKKGKRITNPSIKNPVFYYNGEQISSNKANNLLSSNKGIAVSTKNYNNGNYAVVLNNLNKTSAYNPNNINHNANANLNHNPNSAIDFTEVIAKGATFYLEGKKISSEEATRAVNTDATIHIQTITEKNSHPVVLISKKPIIKNKKGFPKTTADNIIDHIKVMNRHNAKFYLNNTEVTYKAALKYVRKNREADVTTSSEANVVIIKTK